MGSAFKIKVKINSYNQIIKDHGLDRDGKVTEFLRNDVDRLLDPYVPMSSVGSASHMKNRKTYPNNYSIRYLRTICSLSL